MHDVAADRNHQPLDPAPVAADGQRIEQRLGRMFVGAVAGVDHGTVNLARQQLDRARGMVPDHQNVRVHGIQRHRGIDQGFPLAHR